MNEEKRGIFMPYKICKHAMNLINQGISWCDLNCDSFPSNCGEKCPKYEEVNNDYTVTSTNTGNQELVYTNEHGEVKFIPYDEWYQKYLNIYGKTPLDHRPLGMLTEEEIKNGANPIPKEDD